MTNIQYRPVNKKDLEATDYLIKISGGRQAVTTDNDWVIISKIFEFWTRRWPEEWQEFGMAIKDIKETRLRTDGMSESRDTKYVGALPPRFMKLIKAVFPFQQFDKKFVYELTRRIKIIKVGEKHDSWFII